MENPDKAPLGYNVFFEGRFPSWPEFSLVAVIIAVIVICFAI